MCLVYLSESFCLSSLPKQLVLCIRQINRSRSTSGCTSHDTAHINVEARGFKLEIGVGHFWKVPALLVCGLMCMQGGKLDLIVIVQSWDQWRRRREVDREWRVSEWMERGIDCNNTVAVSVPSMRPWLVKTIRTLLDMMNGDEAVKKKEELTIT